MTRAEAIKCIEEDGIRLGAGDFVDVEALKVAVECMKEQNVTDTNVGNKWISVEDRLPEKYTIVLCYKDGQRRLGYYIGAEYGKGVAAFRHPKDQFAFGVTHWMPLPEPPKEDAE